jgi:hypothetical protein
MDISQSYSFRENCSDSSGSFWIDKFLDSTDKFNIQVPEGLIGKRIVWEKVTLKAKDSQYNATNYIIVGVKAGTAPAPKVTSKTPPTTAPVTETSNDPMETAKNLAIGKTEAQFRTAISFDPAFTGSPLISLAKAGMLTQALINDGKLVKTKKGNLEIYALPS